MITKQVRFIRSISLGLFVLALIAIAMPASAGKQYTMAKGDTLWDLAQKFYGDPTLYPVFLEVNGISNPRTIPVGRVIIVPNIDEMKKVAAESDPAKRSALIASITGNKSTSSGSSTGSNSGNNSGTGANGSSETVSTRNFASVLEGPKSPDAVKSRSTIPSSH
ncbi:MAG: LysM peptidoglycan-binding domain-containing protein [Candidatus Riflebacteria bacterium]|nr:LysM peptidoglycan-binding domain-containing protein [Candidatus Riflebacteria bacterium]